MPATFRAAFTFAALALPLVACDAKPEPGDSAADSQTTAPEDTTGETTQGAEDPTESTTSTTGNEDSATEGSATAGATSTTSSQPNDGSCNEEAYGDSRACDGGIQYCAIDWAEPEYHYFWGPCRADFQCVPGQQDDGCTSCQLNEQGVPVLIDECGGDSETSTPLVLSFGGGPVRYDSSAAAFDLGPQCGATDWPTAETPWLALDRDGSGAIETGRELFGSAVRLRRGVLADNGFQALAELDQNRDGKLTAADPDFARLVLWADGDADRRSTAFELTPMSAAGIVEISLTYREDSRCDGRANCEIERAAFTFRDDLGRERVGDIVDVHLACQ
ncbi:calcium-binding protein [Nannocystis punicea]|uniref:Calcium-binding protein n=1 Tax=Nannocystis punicea TaxID=2995304 RepID=A0ABY7GXS9_9BACT|nr:calcium-binding protein [Nannocystis poenicansa]WAS91782.1 calcium-binding protein [Nannocystis poenicansa]